MKRRTTILLSLALGWVSGLRAQYVYTIKADSVKITNCDSAELIIENHTQNVPGFLFNTGNGRTSFKRGVQKLTDTSFLIGADTMTLPRAWVQGGNRFADTGVLGTLDNYPLTFYSNGTEQARLTTSGNLLIGTRSESFGYKTQIAGKSSWSAGGGGIIVDPTLSFSTDVIIVGGRINTGDGQDILLSASSNNGASFTNVLVERQGSIGIGSSAPTGWVVGNPNIRINANSTLSFNSQVMVFGNTDGPFNSSGLYTMVSNVNEWNQADGYPNGQNYYYFGTQLHGPYAGYKRAPLKVAADQLEFLSGPTDVEVGRFSEAGNFLLGSATDDSVHKFQLTGGMMTTGSVRFAGLTQDSTQTQVLVADGNGNLFYRNASSLALNDPLKVKKLIVQPDAWADYVFDSVYRLPELADVEAALRKDHHLPGIPTTAEVTKDGVDVGANQAALLKKIEELTLYVINQNKKIEDQEKRLAALTAALEGFKNQQRQ